MLLLPAPRSAPGAPPASSASASKDTTTNTPASSGSGTGSRLAHIVGGSLGFRLLRLPQLMCLRICAQAACLGAWWSVIVLDVGACAVRERSADPGQGGARMVALSLAGAVLCGWLAFSGPRMPDRHTGGTWKRMNNLSSPPSCAALLDPEKAVHRTNCAHQSSALHLVVRLRP